MQGEVWHAPLILVSPKQGEEQQDEARRLQGHVLQEHVGWKAGASLGL